MHDEVRNYLNARYVDTLESMWRLLENRIQSGHWSQEQIIPSGGSKETGISKSKTEEHATENFVSSESNGGKGPELSLFGYSVVTCSVSRQKGGDNVIARPDTVNPKY